MNPERLGTKAAAHYRLKVDPGRSAVVRLRLIAQPPAGKNAKTRSDIDPSGRALTRPWPPGCGRRTSSTASVTPPSVSPDAANVMRQAIAGMLWSKQYYYWDGDAWLEEHRAHPLHQGSRDFRNREWFHMVNEDIISMPDKWEYPWYAAWDLAFHTLPISIVDPDFAKEQMKLMLRGVYLHPSGQLPAYEWNFSDVNPPVHAWATLFLHRTEQALRGETDVDFLKSAFNKLLAELHLVGEPQGPVRQERLRGRLSRPRQHRRLRPERPAADGRLPGAGGRHGVDGPLHAEHARDRRRSSPPTTPSTRTWSSSSPSISSISPRP